MKSFDLKIIIICEKSYVVNYFLYIFAKINLIITMKKIQILIALLITTCFFSQIKFEKGYFIDNSGKKTDCLIKNIDWNYNPTSFEYKLSENDKESRKNTIKNVEEFGIYNDSKYIKYDVLIDRTTDNLNFLGINKEPTFNTETIFLKILEEGDINLYKYSDSNIVRFFYGDAHNTPQQLIYLAYSIDEDKIGYNNYFQNQIKENLKCSSISESDIYKLSYKENTLTDIFAKYNQCSNPLFSSNNLKRNNGSFNLNIRPRISFNSLSISNSIINTQIDFDKKNSFGVGIEGELILPFNKNKWSIIIEPQYQYFKSNKIIPSSDISGNYIVSNINYKSIDLPIGIRHYFLLNSKSKIFINAQYSINLDLNSSFNLERIDGSKIYNDINIKSNSNFVLGAGYKYDKYSLEVRYNTNRNILSDYAFWNSNYNYASIIFGYTLF